MVSVDNLASKLFSLISSENKYDEFKEWRLLGQERDGNFLFSWIQSNATTDQSPYTRIGEYNYQKNVLVPIFSFDKKVECTQASVNSARTFLGFVLKTSDATGGEAIYNAYLYRIGNSFDDVVELQNERRKQVVIQFLYPKQSVLSGQQAVKFLLMIHQEGIYQYQIQSKATVLNDSSIFKELLVKKFIWAQWDAIQQTLYYIHHRKRKRGLVEGEDDNLDRGDPTKITPTLSGLQFNDELPHETVLNIPLNLPHLSTSESCLIYEDDAVPLRIHDCSLDLLVVTDSQGFVCICHHYLYQPVQPMADLSCDDVSPVHFAYSVTVLHQSCVIHCVVPDIQWSRAKKIRPLFKKHGDYLMVFIPEICTHLLDIGLTHEPSCHITTKPLIMDMETHLLCLASLVPIENDYVVNLATLDLIDLTIPDNLLVETFESDTLLENKLGILHYFLLHSNELELATELITWHSKTPLNFAYPQILKEYLLATSYASIQRNLPQDAIKLATLLPVTTQKVGLETEVKINDYTIGLSQDILWNASTVLLSPQQRIVPYRSDIWMKLWEQLAKLSKGSQRFKPSQVVDKLMVSLDCYQPEALSRCSTPLSPSGGASSTFTDFLSGQTCAKSQADSLPFLEIDSCTASRQEHIISVNLREISMHLLKQSSNSPMNKFPELNQSPMHVHAVATRYVTAQLDQSRKLCQILCKAAAYDSEEDFDKGFIYINKLDKERRYVMFKLLEKYYLAVQSIAFPLPQGFTSFFTFLGYKTMDFEMFLQYVNRNVFELQVDVMKIIMAESENSKADVRKKLKLLSALPRSRAKRLLNQWNHPVSVMARAREHAQNILSGITAPPSGKTYGIQKSRGVRGIAAYPSSDNLSPLDTFLDLLTAKASLTDIDFGLLIEATEASTEDFL
nr:protein pigeon [Leptinotarsa decemlineata]